MIYKINNIDYKVNMTKGIVITKIEGSNITAKQISTDKEVTITLDKLIKSGVAKKVRKLLNITLSKGWSEKCNKWVTEYNLKINTKVFRIWPLRKLELQKEAVKTVTYFTFKEYIEEYKCSYYNVPTNYEKAQSLSGGLINVKEGCAEFDRVIKGLRHNEQLATYVKFQ